MLSPQELEQAKQDYYQTYGKPSTPSSSGGSLKGAAYFDSIDKEIAPSMPATGTTAVVNPSNPTNAPPEWLDGVLKPFATAVTSALAPIHASYLLSKGDKEGANRVIHEGYDFPGIGKIAPVGGNVVPSLNHTVSQEMKDQGIKTGIGEETKRMVGTGAEIAPYFMGGEGAAGLGEGIAEKVPWKQLIKTGAKEGAVIGGTGGFGSGLEEAKGSVEDQAKHVIGSTTIGALLGAPLGAAGSALGGAGAELKNLAENKTVDSSFRSKAIDMAKEAWKEPAGKAIKFKDASAIFNRDNEFGHDISQTLVDNRILPSDHVDGNKFDTHDSADALREQAVKTSNELLRPSIVKASPHVEMTPVSDLISGAKSEIESSKSLTEEAKDSLLEKLNRTQISLEKKYPRGMSLENLHDEKITRSLNVRRSPTGEIETNLEAQKNEALRDVAQKMVEQKAPPELPVKPFNDALTRQFHAADYLDALHGKNVPVGLKAKIAKSAAKIGGAVVGQGLGGGILGGVGGYHLGGMLEEMLSTLPGKARDSLIRNLETTNPEVFAAVQKYLDTEHPIPLGPASEAPLTAKTEEPVDQAFLQRKQQFNTDVKDALHEMEQIKDDKAREDLRKIMEERKPERTVRPPRPTKPREY